MIFFVSCKSSKEIGELRKEWNIITTVSPGDIIPFNNIELLQYTLSYKNKWTTTIIFKEPHSGIMAKHIYLYITTDNITKKIKIIRILKK